MQKFNFIGLLFLAIGLVGCASSSSSKSGNQANLPAPSELSLKSGSASAMTDVPADVKRANQDLALILELMRKPFSGDMEEPSRVREKFNKILRQRREAFDKEMRALRENFNKNEAKERADFLSKFSRERELFRKSKKTSEQSRAFYAGQDERRQSYFGDERDRRKDFESQITERRRNFEDFVRERTPHFNQEYQAYYKRHAEAKRLKDSDKRGAGSPSKSGPQNPDSLSGDSGDGSVDVQPKDEFDQMPEPNSKLEVQ